MKGLRSFAGLAATAVLAGIAGAQDISVYVNGEPVRFSGVGPRQVNGRVMVPLRGVMEKIGAYVSYLPESKTVIAAKGDVDMQLRLGQTLARVNGREMHLDVPAQTYAGTTLVPLRFMSEALGAQVTWDAPAMAVRIQTPNAQQQVVDTPQRAQPIRPTPPEPFVLNSFEMDKSGYLRAGDRVTFTLQGSRGGEASMQIPGFTDPIKMAEVEPGKYQAIVTVPAGPMTISKANVVARLKVGDQERFIQAGSPFMVDTQAPILRNPMPEPASKVTRAQPNISIEFEDLNGSGIDRNSVRVTLDGRDVSNEVTVTGSTLFYRPNTPLNSGEHTLRVRAADMAGNAVEREWKFTVASNRDVVNTFVHTGAKRLEPGEVVTFTLTGAPKGAATFAIGDRILDIPMREVEPGKYVGEYTVRLGDDLRGLPVRAKLRTQDGEVYTVDANQLVGEIGPPTMPTITSPEANASVGSTVNIKGTAGKRAKVVVRIDYRSSLLGLLGVTGTIAERTVFADENGNWETGNIRLDSIAGGSGTTYTVTAKAVGENDVESEVASVSFRR